MKNEGAKDKITGKAKEAMGKMTGDRRKEAEGKADQAKGKTKDAMDGARDRAGRPQGLPVRRQGLTRPAHETSPHPRVGAHR